MDSKKESFDLIVVGGGTAGLRTALYAASHNHTVALIEPGALGGTCLNVGCIPTKTLLHSSHLYASLKNMKKYGINVNKPSFDFKAIMKRMHSIINEGQEHISVSIKNKNLTLIREKASFVDGETVRAGNRLLSSNRFIICTGAKPRVPPVKGLDKVKFMVSDDVLSLTTLPKSIVIVGGGYIALELATFFNELGSKVTIIEKNPRLLKDLDADIVEILQEEYLSRGVVFNLNMDILEIQPAGKNKKIIISDATKKTKTIIAESLLMATGRAPNTFGLNLEAASVKVGEKGNIEVNNKLQTSNNIIYAIGDVTGKAPFAHAAKRESHIALVNALDNENEDFNTRLVPWAMFTSPPISGVGLSEQQTKDNKIDYGILKAPFNRAGRATVIGDTIGFAKVLYNKKDRKIIGATIIGPKADELIHEFVVLMNCDATIDKLTHEVIHIHPTLSEVFEALKDVPVE